MIGHTAFPHTVLATPQPVRHPKTSVKAASLAYLIFERSDLDKAEQYLTDFGLILALRSDDQLYLHGTGPAQPPDRDWMEQPL
ncbi:hypothetical protein [Pseudomonas frederiksbergensis]|jgi:hypothetical protein|uniref:hypothetical protein n=1 Tax=Pseudomonas frederiksbergensis TaxID=104087 RepID=UPI003D1E3093